MDLVPVVSDSIRAIGYGDSAGRLTVVFRSGYVYVFWGVPAAVHDAFLKAPSKGRFFNQRIRSRYASARAA